VPPSPGPAPTARGARPPAGAQKKTSLGLTKQQLYYGGGAFVIALVWFVWHRKQQAAAASTQQTATSSECTDAQGNPTPCAEANGIDYSGQLSVIQTELESLLAGGAAGVRPPRSGSRRRPGCT
jgi:hypothetical protein